MLSHKNTKFLFDQFNQYFAQIGKPLKSIRHTIIGDDNYALTVIQVKKWQYFADCLLEKSLQTTVDEQTFLADGTPEFYHNLSLQALSKSDDSIRLEFIAIVDLVKNIAQLLNDRTEAAIVSTKESDRYFASFLDEKEKVQQNIDEIDKATTEDNVGKKRFTPPTVPLEDEIKKKK